MKITRFTVLLLIVVAPANCIAQSKRAAQRAWAPFFKTFRQAVAQRDRETLRNMLPPDSRWSSGHHRRMSQETFFDYWDERNGRGWRAFNRILSQGALPMARWWNNGKLPKRSSRVALAAANQRSNIDRDRIIWYAEKLRFDELDNSDQHTQQLLFRRAQIGFAIDGQGTSPVNMALECFSITMKVLSILVLVSLLAVSHPTGWKLTVF